MKNGMCSPEVWQTTLSCYEAISWTPISGILVND
jgi:hypothetical protein